MHVGCVLPNREQALAILSNVYGTCRFDPHAHRHDLARALEVKGIAAYLLKNDAHLNEMKIGEVLDCNPKAAATHISQGERLLREKRAVRELIEHVRAQVRKTLGLPEPLPPIPVAKPEPVVEAPLVPEPLEIAENETYCVTRDTTVRDVARVVGRILDVPAEKVLSTSRAAPETDARHITAALSKRLRPERSMPYIGKQLERDHTTVLSGFKKINACLRDESRHRALRGRIELVCTALSLEPVMLVIRSKDSD